MKLILFCTIFLTITIKSVGQTDHKTATVEIVGTAVVSIRPDVGVLNIAIESKSLNFKEAIVHLNSKTSDINRQLTSIGFKETDVKTANFQITENVIYRDNKALDSGYLAVQHVLVKFKNQNDIITKILNTFSKSQTDFKLSFEFELSEEVKGKAQKDLIERAISDAKGKSEIISRAASVRLKRIKEIKYGADYYGGMRRMYEVPPPLSEPIQEKSITGFTPNDLFFKDQVLIVWEIE